MRPKSILAAVLLIASFGVHAIPPVTPPAIYNKIRTIAARNCKTIEGDIYVSDLKDTEQVKFVLQLNKEGTGGILTVFENGKASENINVTCK